MIPYEVQRRLIVEVSRDLSQKGFLSATGGNLSVRLQGEDGLVVTPSNLDYLQMLPEDVCVVGFNQQTISGERKPSVETGMHAAIYQARPDVNAIIHTHQVYPSTLALIGEPIPALFDEQVRFLGRSVNIIPYAPSGTGSLVKNVSRFVKDHNNAYIMANHGAILFGGDMERAVHNVAVLEKCALAYLLALCTDKKVSRVPLYVKEIAFSKLRQDQKKYERSNTNRTADHKERE